MPRSRTTGQPPASEWQHMAGALKLLGRQGWDEPAQRALLRMVVVNGRMGVRQGQVLCPPDIVQVLEFDFDRGLVFGWQIGGAVMNLRSDDETGSMQVWREPDPGAACEFNMLDLFSYIPELLKLEAPVARKNLGGRPGSWNWGGAMLHVGAHIYTHGVPPDHVAIVALLRDWFLDNSAAGGPDDKQLREWAQQAHAAFTGASETSNEA